MIESAFFSFGRKAKKEESQSQAELNGNMLLLEAPDTTAVEKGNQAGTRLEACILQANSHITQSCFAGH